MGGDHGVLNATPDIAFTHRFLMSGFLLTSVSELPLLILSFSCGRSEPAGQSAARQDMLNDLPLNPEKRGEEKI